MSESIEHRGIVESIEGNTVSVRIIQLSACTSCQVHGFCGAADKKEKIIKVIDKSGFYKVGDEVQLCGQTSLGRKAVFYAFIIPLILIIATIASMTAFGFAETTSAFAGLIILAIYYLVLYLLRNSLDKQFIFMLKKLN